MVSVDTGLLYWIALTCTVVTIFITQCVCVHYKKAVVYYECIAHKYVTVQRCSQSVQGKIQRHSAKVQAPLPI